MDNLRQAVKESIVDLFDKERLPTSQPETTAFSMMLTARLGLAEVRNEAIIYGSPHSSITRELLRKRGLRFEPVERMVDFVVVDRETKTFERPVLACETEAFTGWKTDYTFELETKDTWKDKARWPVNGYVWDFWKLLHFRSPHLLLVARCRKKQMEALRATLLLCASEYRSIWKDARLEIVLLPAGGTEKDYVTLGMASNGGMIRFEAFTP